MSDEYDIQSPLEGFDTDSEKEQPDFDVQAAQKRLVEKWFKKIDKARSEMSDFRRSAKRACERYNMKADGQYDHGENHPATYYPLLWSNVQVIRGTLYTSTPSPDVRRRDGRREPMFRAAAIAMDRGLSALIDMQDFDGQVNRAVTDNLVPGMAQVRLNYDADVDYQPIIDPATGQPMTDEFGVALQQPNITNECVCLEHVPWDRFNYDPCMQWADCQWVDYVHYMDRHDVIEQFEFDPKQAMAGATQSAIKEGRQKYEIHEVWDKRKKRILFLMRGLERPLRVAKDLLDLKNFFPSPKPWFANCATDGFKPIPDYLFYETQDKQINRLTQRIINLTATGTVARGLYDSSIGEEMAQIAGSDDLEYVPVSGLWNKMHDAGSGGGSLWDRVVADFPIKNTVDVIQILQMQRESELQHVYQITGISDIMRGSSKASETAKAQAIKSAAASSRASIRKQSFAFFIRETIEIMAEMAATHFQTETWQGLTGIEFNEQLEGIIRNDMVRTYAIDIETDSTIALDDQANKEATMEAVNVTTNMLGTLLPMMNQGLPGDVVKQIATTAMQPFKETRNFEDAIAQLPTTKQQIDQLNQSIQQGQQQNQEMQQEIERLNKLVDEYKMHEAMTKRIAAVAEAQRDQKQGERLEAQSVEDLAMAEFNLARAEEIRTGERGEDTDR